MLLYRSHKETKNIVNKMRKFVVGYQQVPISESASSGILVCPHCKRRDPIWMWETVDAGHYSNPNNWTGSRSNWFHVKANMDCDDTNHYPVTTYNTGNTSGTMTSDEITSNIITMSVPVADIMSVGWRVHDWQLDGTQEIDFKHHVTVKNMNVIIIYYDSYFYYAQILKLMKYLSPYFNMLKCQIM